MRHWAARCIHSVVVTAGFSRIRRPGPNQNYRKAQHKLYRKRRGEKMTRRKKKKVKLVFYAVNQRSYIGGKRTNQINKKSQHRCLMN